MMAAAVSERTRPSDQPSDTRPPPMPARQSHSRPDDEKVGRSNSDSSSVQKSATAATSE